MWGRTKQSESVMLIERARLDGIKAWRISIMNAMLAEDYRGAKRRYRWSRSELSQLCGVDIQTVNERDAETDNG